MKIIPVTAQNYDAQKLAPLLKQSQAEGYNLVLRMIEGWDSGKNRFDKAGEAFFAAEHEGRWLGMGGRSVDPYLNDAKALRVRHVYVIPEWRNFGIGVQLMKKIMHIPDGDYDRLTLRTLTPGARKFYERLGFEPVANSDTVTHSLRLK